jgi:hypothetical protein
MIFFRFFLDTLIVIISNETRRYINKFAVFAGCYSGYAELRGGSDGQMSSANDACLCGTFSVPRMREERRWPTHL